MAASQAPLEPLLPSSDSDSDYVPSEGEASTSKHKKGKGKGKKRSFSPTVGDVDVSELISLAEEGDGNGEGAPKKKQRTRVVVAEEERVERERVVVDGKSLAGQEVEDVWRDLNTSNGAHGDSANGKEEGGPSVKRKVKIRREHEFAGEKVVEEIEVDEDSQEAQEYFNPPTCTTETPPPPARERGPPKKRRGASLSAMANSIRKGKPKKLSTMEKSALDWKQYVSEEDGLKESLERERKDGYLQRKDFLDRAREREEEERYAKKKV
ncbi:BCNT-domain-containing protein [Atractiella rhizophila]|nr:BCNT-domain-containing protein [Atractiella rhizophila]